MAKKPALGRGLGAILPDYDQQDDPEQHERGASGEGNKANPFEDRPRRHASTMNVPIDRIDPNPYQPRSDFDGESLEELAESIRELGVIQPITVRPAGRDRFELISGERRLRAARRAGLQDIPAYIRQADTEAMLEMALVENVQRKDLNPIEIAMGYQRLIEECALTHEDLSRKVGKSRSAISNTLRLLKLPAEMQLAIQQDSISEGHARALATVEDIAYQRRLIDRIPKEGLSVRAVERLARSHADKKARKKNASDRSGPPVDPHVEAVTDQLRRVYGTRIQIKNKADGGGRIELDYFSPEELERLLELLLRS